MMTSLRFRLQLSGAHSLSTSEFLVSKSGIMSRNLTVSQCVVFSDRLASAMFLLPSSAAKACHNR